MTITYPKTPERLTRTTDLAAALARAEAAERELERIEQEEDRDIIGLISRRPMSRARSDKLVTAIWKLAEKYVKIMESMQR